MARRRPQDVAKRKLQQTNYAIKRLHQETFTISKRLGRISKRIPMLQQKAARYAVAAAMTDEEVEQERQKRNAAKIARSLRKRTRQIDLDE